MGRMVSKRELCDILNVTSATVTAWQKCGLPCISMSGRRGKPSQYDLAEVFTWAREQSARSGDTEGIDGKYEQARLTQLKADREQIEIRVREGELLNAAESAVMWERMLGAFRARVLSIPAAMADELAQVSDPRKIQDRLKSSISSALEELANADAREYVTEPDDSNAKGNNAAGAQSLAPAPKPHRVRVGRQA